MLSLEHAVRGRLRRRIAAAAAVLIHAVALPLFAASVPTGLPASPTFGAAKFTQPMPRFDLLTRKPLSALSPAPTAQANTTQQPVDPLLGGGTGPIEGRPPGPIWAHQGFAHFPPLVAVEATMEGAKVNAVYNPGVPASLNSGINPATPLRPRFHPNMPDQGPLALWTFKPSATDRR